MRRNLLNGPRAAGFLWGALCCVWWLTARAVDEPDPARPNFVLIYADDLGYGDLGCYGNPQATTPNLDRLAAEGLRFTDFYVAQAVCSASRAALLTGCYPNRIGILGALGPRDTHGIADSEWTLAEVLAQRGYACAVYGKWHLGRQPRFLPPRHGFDDYFGLPYSNDMWPKHPEVGASFPELPLLERETVVALNPDQSLLTTQYAQRAVAFIEAHAAEPFFLYVPHTMPHVPLAVSEERAGRTGRGLFADVLAEIDWSVGEIVAALEQHGLRERTLVLFASDNGPWLSYGDHAGTTGGLREGKGTTFEGGVRVPCVISWPGVVAPGSVCTEPVMTIDVLPTFAALCGADLPQAHGVDGCDVSAALRGEPLHLAREALYFYWGRRLEALRSGRWKLHLPHAYRTLAGRAGGQGGQPVKYEQAEQPLALYDLVADPAETTDCSAEQPEVVARLLQLAETARADLGDAATGRTGANVREPGRVEP